MTCGRECATLRHRKGPHMPTIAFVLIALAALGILLLTSAVKIVQEYERGVIFRLGRLAV